MGARSDQWRGDQGLAVNRILTGHLAILLLVVALSGCSAGDPADYILGRWQRSSPAGLDRPMALMAEYLELRPDGQLITLLYDESKAAFWEIGGGEYRFPAAGQISVSGRCWGATDWESCTHIHSFQLRGQDLTLV